MSDSIRLNDARLGERDKRVLREILFRIEHGTPRIPDRYARAAEVIDAAVDEVFGAPPESGD